MKIQNLIIFGLFATFLSFGLAGTANSQTDDRDYIFVVFETTVTRKGVETSSENPEERRFYVSNVVGFPSSDQAQIRRASKIADEYFTSTVVEPMKAKGIVHSYYDDGIQINANVVYRLDTRAEVEELRTKTLEDLKEQGVNIFTFNWAFGEISASYDTAQPQLFYRATDSPLYGQPATKTVVPKSSGTAPKRKP